MQDLDIFGIVVEQQSLNRASKLLNLSQPALSRRVMRLEERLDVKLFSRNGKRLALTQAGKLCYEYAVRLKLLESELLQSIAQFKSGEAPLNITIGASLTTLQSTLPELIALYTEEFPHSDMKALTGKTHEIVTLVQEKRVDLGLVASNIDSPSLHCIPLFDDHLCLVLPSGHSLAEKQSLHLSDIHNLPMILFSKGTWYRILMDELFLQYNIFPNLKMEIDSFEAIIRLLPTCHAATLLPMSYLRNKLLENNDLIARNIPELEETKRTTTLIFGDEVSRNAKLHAFVWKAKEHFIREQDND